MYLDRFGAGGREMKLTKREIRGVVVVEIKGKLIGGPDDSDKFHGFIKALLDDGKNRIVISLRSTPWADSRGIGMLIGAYTSVKNAGGELVLAHVVDRINSILSVTRLLLIFTTFENVEEAVDYLESKTEDSQDVNSESRLPQDEDPTTRATDNGIG